ncbi:MAG: Jag N-terminal domain-containing protein [Clostridia bacterium]|nr:Jag N-terminal domain-containing protein [Clostridia bacterium]
MTRNEEKTVKKEMIITAKTVEEALAKAVAELGAPNAEAIEYTVLEEAKKGFLGIGATPAKISAAYTLSGADMALDFVRTLIAGMGIEASVEMTEDGENKLIRVNGESAGVLIGHHGDTLDSLQYLANLAANKKVAGEKR